MNEKDRQLQVINCVHAIRELQSLKAVCRTLGDDILNALDDADDLIEKKLTEISRR
tara:strand:- start:109 stop:276 length:168 start_codon:yes stop_codon:yes gene_type:complete